MEELVIFAVLVVLFALAIGAMIGWHEFLKWYAARPQRVKTSQPATARDSSSAAGNNPGSASGSRRVDPPHLADTSQLEPSDPAVYEPPADPLIISHKMSKKELTILLAAQKDADGAYRFSANKIAEFVGGTSSEIKGWVADVRGRREPASSRLTRPANGW